MSSSGAGTGPPGPTGATGATGAAGTGYTTAVVPITAAQAMAFPATPITAVAAPGAGKILVPTGVTFEVIPGLTAVEAIQFGVGIVGLTNGSGNYTYGYLSQRVDLWEYGVPTFDVAALVNDIGHSIANVTLRSAMANKALVISANGVAQSLTGPIVTSTLNAGGAAYVVGDTGTIDGDQGPANTPATYVINTVAAITGAVLTYTITNNEPGYVVANAVTTTTGGAQPGIGTGFKINITSIPAADGTMYVTVYYLTQTLH